MPIPLHKPRKDYSNLTPKEIQKVSFVRISRKARNNLIGDDINEDTGESRNVNKDSGGFWQSSI